MNQINDINQLENLLDYQEYFIRDFDHFLVGKTQTLILIKTKGYEVELNLEKLTKIFNILFKSIDEAYIFIINLFEENKISANTVVNQFILKIKLDNKNEREIILNKSSKENDKESSDDYENFKINKITLSIDKNSKLNLIQNSLVTNLYGSSVLEHIFLGFKSCKDVFYIIYSNIERNILLYDLKINKLIAQIKKCT